MADEDTEGQGGGPPASGDQEPKSSPAAPEGGEGGAPAPSEPEKGEEAGGVDYKEEVERIKQEFENVKQELAKRDTQIKKAEFLIRKLKKRLEEEGIEVDETEPLTIERINEIVSQTITSKLGEIENVFSKKLSEVVKSLTAMKSKGTGEGGQKPPMEYPRPKLSAKDEALVRKFGLKWDSKKQGWVDPNGRFFKFPSGASSTPPVR